MARTPMGWLSVKLFLVGLEDLAAADFSAAWAAVSWALEVFTVEFGMGSGVVPPPWPPGRPNHGSVARRQPAGGRGVLTAAADAGAVCVFLTSDGWHLASGWMSAVEACAWLLTTDV